jgi:predicted DNA-binding transcriptional regulator AlpA
MRRSLMLENANDINEATTLLGRAAPAGFKLLSRKETAALLGVSLLWLWRAARNPTLGFPSPRRLGGDPTSERSPVRYISSEVEAWVRDRPLVGRAK